MTEQTITVVGARGGSGTSTIAAAAALFAARIVATELVAADVDSAAALLGLGAPRTQARRWTSQTASRSSRPRPAPRRLSVVDAGRLDQLDHRPTGLLLVVLRGPCYLGLRSIVNSELHPDGIVVLSETGRSLTLRDVQDVCGVPVVAQIPVTANVARTIDAGLLVTRSRAARARRPSPVRRHARLRHQPCRRTPAADIPQPDLSSPLQRFPSPSTVSPHLDPSTRTTRPKIATDLPVALSATGRAFRLVAFRCSRAIPS